MEEKKKSPKTVDRYLIPRPDTGGMAVLSQEEFDQYLKDGSVRCGDEIIAARDGDEVIRVNLVEKYQLKKEGPVCSLECKKEC